MDLKEIKERAGYLFFGVFIVSVLSVGAYELIFRDGVVPAVRIFEQLPTSALIALAYFVFYSQKRLSTWQIFIRYFMHMFITTVVLIGAAIIFDWIPLSGPDIYWLGLVGMIALIYIMGLVIELYYAHRLAVRLNKRLKDRYSQDMQA